MNRTTKYALGAAALVAVAGVATVSIAGGGRHGHHGWDEEMQGGMGHGRHGMQMLQQFDANKDGKVTQAEIDETRQSRFKTFDKDADGALTLAEFEALWLDAMRERMVDRFQEHDNDGDAKVTAEEFGRHFADMAQFMDSNGDGVIDESDMRRRHPMHDGDSDETTDDGEQ